MNPTDRELLVRSLDADLRPSEEQRLRHLLDRSEAARRELHRMRGLRTLVAEQRAESFGPYFADRVLQAVAREQERTSGSPGAGWLRLLAGGRASAVAWSAALLLLLAALGWWSWPRSVHVAPATMQTVALVDGTTVELSSGSTLRYRPFRGRGVRHVVLEGEAFFDVAPGERPFVVETFNARVEVRGTRFNVRAWPEGVEPQTAVSVQSGNVGVRSLHGDRSLSVRPEETSVVSGLALEPLPPVRVPLSQVMAWRTGGLAFRDRPLDAVASELQRRFGVEVGLATAHLSQLRVAYLDPDPGSLRDVLTAICAPKGLRFRETATGFEIVGGG